MSVQIDLITYEIELDIDTSGNIALNIVDGRFVNVYLKGSKVTSTNNLDFRDGNGTNASVTLSNGRSLVSHNIGGILNQNTAIEGAGLYGLTLGHLTDATKYLSYLYGVVPNTGDIYWAVKNAGTGGETSLYLKGAGSNRAFLQSDNGIVFLTTGGGIGSTAATTQQIVAGTTLTLQAAVGVFTMTTIGGNLFSLTNPSAVTWLRLNADNTVTALTQAQTLAALLAQGLIISETALVSGASIDIAQQNNTLATALTAITFTISNTSTFIYLTITLTGTALTLTFPANTLCVSDGVASGDNTCSLAGVSGDVYEIAIKKRASTYSVVSKNFGQ